MLLDGARHFLPPRALRRAVDALAALKLNVLHLHLSDAEAGRARESAYAYAAVSKAGAHARGTRGVVRARS